MNYPKCPYCGKSDGNDDIATMYRLDHRDNQECKFIIARQCDICGKKYHVGMVYKFSYWKYEE